MNIFLTVVTEIALLHEDLLATLRAKLHPVLYLDKISVLKTDEETGTLTVAAVVWPRLRDNIKIICLTIVEITAIAQNSLNQ